MMASEARDYHGGVEAAARALGINPRTMRRRLAKERGASSPASALEFPVLPDRREPDANLIRRLSDQYARNKAYEDAAEWQRIKVHDDRPIGLAIIGDPHIDDNSCCWPELLADVDVMRATDGLYACNIGDTTNNWCDKLARLFGEQSTSQSEARQAMRWFLLRSGVRWAGVILGNHDLWSEGGEIIRLMCASSTATIPVHEWAGKVEFVFPNGATCRASLAHHFKGGSQWSTTNGPLREAVFNQDARAHFLAAGHIHFGGLQQVELPGGHNPWLIRVRGYKDYDSHAKRGNFHEGRRFRSVLVIIDPAAPEHERCTVFGSIKQGAAVLKSMRDERARQTDTRRNRKGGASSRKKPRRAKGRPGKGPARSPSVRGAGRGRKGSNSRRSKIHAA